jgi:general stress protein CsbA
VQVTPSAFFRVHGQVWRACNGAAVLIVLLTAGAVLLHYTEGTDWLDCMYWSLTTLSTVGYGDIVPHDHKGLFASFFLISVFVFAYTLGEVVSAAAMCCKYRRLGKFFQAGLTPDVLQHLDDNADGTVRPCLQLPRDALL